MASLDPFIMLAEISATFVGFVGIAGILGTSAGTVSSSLGYARIQEIIENALIVLGMAILPTVSINLFEDENYGYHFFSFLLAFAYLFQEVLMLIRMYPIFSKGAYRIGPWLLMTWFVRLIAISVAVANGFGAFENTATVYAIALGIGLGQSSMALLRFFLGSIVVDETLPD